MRTLSNYGERLKNQLDINLIQKEIYLTACSFLKKEYILLNKNLNFIPTPKAYKKTKFDNDLNNFFRLIKLKAHLKQTKTKLGHKKKIIIPMTHLLKLLKRYQTY